MPESIFLQHDKAKKPRVRHDVAQMATSITYSPGTYYYNYDVNQQPPRFTDSVKVGQKMTAILDPADPKQGSMASSAPSVHSKLMERLNKRWNAYKVRGHLLNDHLGGPAAEENLFPISLAANSCHLNQMERYVKYLVYNGRTVHYDVTVQNGSAGQPFSELQPRTKFHCQVFSAATATQPSVNVAYDVESDISNNSTGNTPSPFYHNYPYSGNLKNSPWNPI